ncbi:SelT/SelW/SelH family protein [Bacillus luteus]|uniref:SelT/SelW/SelH family protein n=1 Tax=Alkalicoccus luteus TaxID=1237094 RepID=A0A969PQM6_9BACI|nr:SelT/SelW/SelH family protein [Alkalicoccus luteus]
MRRDIDRLELVPASGGAFEVFKDGILIYSKLDTGSFPEASDITAKLKQS